MKPGNTPVSYYAATRNILQDYPRLDGDHQCDIAVVGGGFTGVSTCLFLAERGYDVSLLEANRISWGASGRNGGQLIDGFTSVEKFEKKFGDSVAAMVRNMGVECRDIVVERIKKYDIDCDLKFGYLDVCGARQNRPNCVALKNISKTGSSTIFRTKCAWSTPMNWVSGSIPMPTLPA